MDDETHKAATDYENKTTEELIEENDDPPLDE